MDGREEVVEADRLAAVVLRQGHQLRPLLQLVEPPVRLPEPGVGEGVARVLLERLLQEREGVLQVLGALEALQVATRLEVVRVRAAHPGVALLEDAPLPGGDRQLEEVCHREHEALLQREGLEGVVPGRQATQDARARRVHQARVEAQLVPETPQLGRHHQRRAEGAPGGGGRGDPRLADVARGDHGQAGVVRLELGEAGGQRLDEAVGAEAILGVGAREIHGQDRHALLGGEGRPAAPPSGGPGRAPGRARSGRRPSAPPPEGRGGAAGAAASERTSARSRPTAAPGAAHLREVLAHAAQLAGEVERRRVALGRVLGQAPLDDPPRRRGESGGADRQRLRLVLDDRGQRLDGALPLERRSAGSPSRRASRRGRTGRSGGPPRARGPARATCTRPSP